MKAITYKKYGNPDVLEFKEVEKPAPRDNEVLIKVHAASLNAYDWHFLKADPFFMRLIAGFLNPKNPMLGADVAGRVEAVGREAKQFHVGDEVYGDISQSGNGAFAEYARGREDALALKPANLTFEEAAAVPMAALTALQGLRDIGKIQAGQKVLIHGASGGVGTFAVQLAKYFGAEVTAVCSTRNVEMTHSLGADHVIDYTKEDFTENGQRYDLILAANGNRSIFDYKRALSSKGIYICVGGSMPQVFQALLLGPLFSKNGEVKIGSYTAHPSHMDLMIMKDLLETGKVKPVIDRRYPLIETAEAMRYLGDGHAQGKVVLTVN